jgi:hypothetical protein
LKNLDKLAPDATTGGLPADISAMLTTFVDLADVAQLGATSRSGRDGFWYSHQMWTALATARGLKKSRTSPLQDAAPECFRKNFFRIDDDHPRALLSQARNARRPAAEILNEATHMLRGLMPQDGHSTLLCVLDAAENAIWFDGASNDRVAHAMGSFLQVARRRDDLLSASQLEQLENAASTVRGMSASLELSVDFFGRESEAAIEAELLDLWSDTPRENDEDYCTPCE